MVTVRRLRAGLWVAVRVLWVLMTVNGVLMTVNGVLMTVNGVQLAITGAMDPIINAFTLGEWLGFVLILYGAYHAIRTLYRDWTSWRGSVPPESPIESPGPDGQARPEPAELTCPATRPGA